MFVLVIILLIYRTFEMKRRYSFLITDHSWHQLFSEGLKQVINLEIRLSEGNLISKKGFPGLLESFAIFSFIYSNLSELSNYFLNFRM